MKTLPPPDLHRFDFKSARFFVEVPNDVSLEEVLTPAFWSHHAGNVRVNNEIVVTRRDGTLHLTAVVTRTAAGMVVLRPLFAPHNDESNVKRLKAEETARLDAKREASGDEQPLPSANPGEEAPEGYKVKHSPAAGYYVLLPDGTNLTKGQKNLTHGQATKIAIDHHRQATTPANVPSDGKAAA